MSEGQGTARGRHSDGRPSAAGSRPAGGQACRQTGWEVAAGCRGFCRKGPEPHPAVARLKPVFVCYTHARLHLSYRPACREDPELRPAFEEIKKGGMAAMMKFMNDPQFLAVRPAAVPSAAPPAVLCCATWCTEWCAIE